MPVPEILYRIVEYQEADSILNVIIVIHNYLDGMSSDKRICAFKDEVFGWDDMKVTNPKFSYRFIGRVYACPVTEDTIKKIQADYEVTKSMRPFVLDEDKQNKITENGPILCAKESTTTVGSTMYYTRDFL